ncbi:MAG: addiction module protein [Isosphaeraceae bacterium]
MSSTLRQLGIDRMTVVERIALVQEILDSVAAEQGRAPLSEAKREELHRRLAELKTNPADGVPWTEVETSALARFTP